jgi:anti-sigma regulatory factor (Ser/Thr protein kinase)
MSFACARKRMAQAVAARKSREVTPEPQEKGGDELQELAQTFQWTVERVSGLMGELEEAHRRALEGEREKQQFYREVIRAVTNGKFELEDEGGVPLVGELVADLPVHNGAEYARAREAIQAAAEKAGMAEERADDVLIAAGEAISNALKHAGGGRCAVYAAPESVVVRITDEGGGIRSLDLPNVILKPGFSTKISLGMGYSLMLKLTDRVWLSTTPEGTVVQIEKKVKAPLVEPSLADAFSRM